MKLSGVLPRVFLALAVGLFGCTSSTQPASGASDPDPLAAGFETPPVSAQPQTWWHWMNGNITKEGITADLEAMHRVGISEANIITVASAIPPGPVPVMSPQFFDMVEYAAKEANRVGMTLCMDNCPGWSSSGGPWVKPQYAMQIITTSETHVTGPKSFSAALDQPPTKENFYRDIAVLAFKTPVGQDNQLLSRDNPPKLNSNIREPHLDRLLDPDSKGVRFPVPTDGHPIMIDIELPKPITTRTLILTIPGKLKPVHAQIETSEDGKTFHLVRAFTFPSVNISLGDQPVTSRFFRIEFISVAANTTGIDLKAIGLSDEVRIENIGAKAAFDPAEVSPLDVEKASKIQVDPQNIVQRDQIVDLTSAMKPDGSVTWSVPEGSWTIVRFGYTCTGITNHPAPPEATGLECDKLSTEGLDESWNGMMQPILNRLGPLSKVLDDCLIDSYETGDENWTPKMAEEFKLRRGYDPTPFLPVLTGRIVDSPAVSERFLWDMRRTVADLFAQKYYAHFTELCHEHGMKSMIEPYTGPFESLQCGGPDDIPMAEFWAGTTGHISVKMASSVGHIYGQQIIAAESFTGHPEHGGWEDDPYALKPLGDMSFCLGINRFVFHRYAHQPWLNRYPGMTMGQWGINFDRTNTWFEWSKPWLTYIARCQYLLQQGRSISDVAYFCGESAPVVSRDQTPMPDGYDHDQINAEVLLTRASMVNHRLTLQSGASYAVLVLPPSDPEMTPELLAKIHDFVNDGLTVVGAPPSHSPSLQGYPDCDQKVQTLAAEMWGNCDGNNVTEHALGQGKVVWGRPLADVLTALNIPPDFQKNGDAPLLYIHRMLENADAYFISNQSAAKLRADCTFRISGKVPELWHPDTGVMEPVPAYVVSGGRVTVPLDFDPNGSVFVVFRNADSTADHVVKATRQLTKDPAVTVDGSWTLNFPPNWGAPASVTLDHLMSWPDYPDKGVKYFSGTATYVKDIDIPASSLADGRMLTLDLGDVKNLAKVTVNGTDLGILWKPPFRVDITAAVKPGTNHLEIGITNLWPNRLIGDEQLPPDVKWHKLALAGWPQWVLDGKPSPTGRLTFTTWHHVTKDQPLLPSGLIGPVTLQAATWTAMK